MACPTIKVQVSVRYILTIFIIHSEDPTAAPVTELTSVMEVIKRGKWNIATRRK
jgi:hypothetical protein